MSRGDRSEWVKEMKKRTFVVNNIRGLRILWNAAPGMILVYILLAAVHAVSWVLEVAASQIFFDGVASMAAGKQGLLQVLGLLLAMGISYAFSQFMNGAFNCYGQICNLKLGKRIKNLLFERIERLDAIEYENTRRLDVINKAFNGSEGCFWVCMTIVDIVFFYGVYFALMSRYMYTLNPILGIAVVIIFIPSILSKMLNTFFYRRLEDTSAPVRRKAEYYEKCMAGRDFLKETRILGAIGYFKERYVQGRVLLNRLKMEVQLKKSVLDFFLSTITVFSYGIIIYLLFVSIMEGKVTVGAFAAVLMTLGRIYSFMNEVVTERFGFAAEQIATVENYLNFIYEESDPQPEGKLPAAPDIRLDHVDFSYPGVQKKVLDDISLTIRNGQTVAVVGENGSGKSTLCRILLGIYRPDSGEVLYGGSPLLTMERDGLSAVFQKFCRYKMTVGENIKISRTERGASEETISALCEEVGLKLEGGSFPEGVNTMLGRDFDGTEISGGQWQRIAIARGLLRNSELIVLDEPTAAIDPLEETRLYKEFADICKEKTAVIVTHRLASAKIADRILVVSDGKIIQDGSHEQLMAQEGEYQKMYREQQKWYAEN